MQQGKPEIITFDGVHLLCYSYGHDVGVADALVDSATAVQTAHQRCVRDLAVLAESISRSLPPEHKLQPQIRDLPRTLIQLERAPGILRARAEEHRKSADRTIVGIKEAGVGQPWWRSRATVAIGGHAVTVLISTLAALLLARWLW